MRPNTAVVRNCPERTVSPVWHLLPRNRVLGSHLKEVCRESTRPAPRGHWRRPPRAGVGSSPSVVEIKRVYVRPAYRGVKLGATILQRLLADARVFGYARVRLDTAPFMHAAHTLYEAARICRLRSLCRKRSARFLALQMAIHGKSAPHSVTEDKNRTDATMEYDRRPTDLSGILRAEIDGRTSHETGLAAQATFCFSRWET